MREVYLDHAATTYLDPRAKKAMEPYWSEEFGNPSSLYRAGRRAKEVLDDARTTVARLLNCRSEEVVFTGGGTEAINLAIFGVAKFYSNLLKNSAGAKGHLITSKIEHHAVLHAMEALQQEGFEVTYIDVDEYGLVNPEDVRKALRPDTILVSVMYANNEIGTIEPIQEIGRVIKEFKAANTAKPTNSSDPKLYASNPVPLFMTDACQAAGALPMDVDRLGVDLLAMNASKIYGPKGVGCLFARRGVRLKPLIYGGGQENNLRSGTENVAGIVGFAKAFEISEEMREAESGRLVLLRDYFTSRILREIPKTILNGHPKLRLPNNVNVSILDIEGEAAVLYLDSEGISISTGSACTSTTLDPSHVILALGRPYEYAHGSLRFTLGRGTSKEDLDYVMGALPRVVEKIRKISPLSMEVGQKEISHPEAFAGQGAKIKVGGRSYK